MHVNPKTVRDKIYSVKSWCKSQTIIFQSTQTPYLLLKIYKETKHKKGQQVKTFIFEFKITILRLCRRVGSTDSSLICLLAQILGSGWI